MLIAAALSDGKCILKNGLKSDDTLFTAGALKEFGIFVHERDDGFVVMGSSGVFQPGKTPIIIVTELTPLQRRLLRLLRIPASHYGW